MQIRDIIFQMAQRAFSFQFHDGILDMYSARDYGATEPDYETGFNYLASILTEDQRQALNHMENTYIARRNYAAEYGFKCGMYGAFRQFFGSSGARDGGFDDLVGNDLLMQPKMQRHHQNYANIELCNKIDAEIMTTLSKEDQEHIVSVTCAWQQRVYSAAMDGFYCGYRAAYDLMEAINPLVKVQNMEKILTMEYHLGYIKPYSEVERLHSMAA